MAKRRGRGLDVLLPSLVFVYRWTIPKRRWFCGKKYLSSRMYENVRFGRALKFSLPVTENKCFSMYSTHFSVGHVLHILMISFQPLNWSRSSALFPICIFSQFSLTNLLRLRTWVMSRERSVCFWVKNGGKVERCCQSSISVFPRLFEKSTSVLQLLILLESRWPTFCSQYPAKTSITQFCFMTF